MNSSDRQFAKFVAVLLQNLPDLERDDKQYWIEDLQHLQAVLRVLRLPSGWFLPLRTFSPNFSPITWNFLTDLKVDTLGNLVRFDPRKYPYLDIQRSPGLQATISEEINTFLKKRGFPEVKVVV